MCKVWVTSDWHLGHVNCARWREKESGILTEDTHEEVIFDRYCEVVSNKDLVWFLGDIFFNKKWMNAFISLPGRKRLVLGNHDTERLYGSSALMKASSLMSCFEQVHGLVKLKAAWLSHAPIHPSQLRDRYNIHGHVHNKCLDDQRYINVCLEQTNYYPVEYNILWNNRSYPPSFNQEIAMT